MKTIGILGGGQLGMMLLEAYQLSDIKDQISDIKFLEQSKDCSVGTINPDLVTVGDFKNFEDVYEFGKAMDIVTVEIEHVNVEALEKLESEGVEVYPSPAVLRVVQDKGLQKAFYAEHGIPTSAFNLVENKSEILSSSNLIRGSRDIPKLDCPIKSDNGKSIFPIVQKMRTEGYDGKGVQILRSVQDIETKAFDVPSVIEDAVDIDKEIAVIVARSSKGAVVTFPAVEMAFDPETNLVVELFSPASLTPQQDAEAKRMAMEISEKLNVVGLLAVEFFLDKSGKILVNEIAPRPHNSGHHTIEGNKTSQFEQHLRAVAGMKLGSTQIIKPAVMVNVLGEKGYVGPAVYQGRDEIEKMPGVYLHLYGKSETRPARKMGHVTILGDTVEGARVKGQVVRETLKVVSE